MSGIDGEPDLIISLGDCEIYASCSNCSAHLGMIRPDGSLETFAMPWERHVMTHACEWPTA